MGKKGFNWKARQSHDTRVDDSETQKIQIDLPVKEYGVEDACNAIVLPSSKRHTKVKKDSDRNVRILSKQQRKKLEKIVEKKQKKENRAALLEALAKVQAHPDELSQMTSIQAVQSKGLKKNLRISDVDDMEFNIDTTKIMPVEVKNFQKIKTIAGAKKRKYLLTMDSDSKTKKAKRDLNVVGFEQSSGESSDDETSDEEIEESKEKCELVDTVSPAANGEVAVVSSDEESPSKDTLTNGLPENKAMEEDSEIITEAMFSEKKHRKKKRNKYNNNNNSLVEKDPDAGKIKLEKRDTVFVQVDRDPKIQVARLKLPILAEEQSVMECINENAIVLIAGETGSGKTTQVPQFLYEAGYARNNKMIGITEPRRVAAVAMSERVAVETGLSSREVSYLMRYEGNVSDETRIKFMTDGVLLKEIESDFILSKYSVIIIDEAHERSVFTDILIGLLSRIVPLRCKRKDPLRLIIMSATLKIEDFNENTRLFKYPPPVVKIEARQFPVTIHFNKRTEQDYVKAAFSKAIKIHTKLPEGGILIFVTGQQEVNMLVKKLRTAFPYRRNNKSVEKEEPDKSNSKFKRKSKTTDTNAQSQTPHNKSDIVEINEESEKEETGGSDEEQDMLQTLKKAKKLARDNRKKEASKLPEFDLDDFDLPDEEAQDHLLENGGDECDIMDNSDDEDEWEALAMAGSATGAGPLWVLPLFSMLPPQEQARVFKPPPEGCRVCVVATNVAETSLTIPNIKYVIDTGKQKVRVYEKVTGASAMRVVWISRAGAQQRAGRAGRVAPGHCYRLYSSAVLQHDMAEDAEPEIRTRPVDDLLLQMKCMGIDKVVNFPFPSAPDILQLKAAESRLEVLGALEKPPVRQQKVRKRGSAVDEEVLRVTPLGRAISGYPVLPRYGKMLALSHQHNLFQYTICMVAALSVQEVLVGKKKRWTAFGEELLLGDPGALLNIVGAAEHAALSGKDMDAWCTSQGVRLRALKEIRMLRAQLAGRRGGIGGAPPAPTKPPGPLSRPLRQILLAGLGDCVARKVSLAEVKQSQDKVKLKYAYHCAEMEEPVFIHSASVLRKELPEWVVYQEIYEAGVGEDTKMIMRGVTAIEPEWLPVYVPKLCNNGDPLQEPPPRYDSNRDKVLCHVNATFSRSGWQIPTVEVDFPTTPDIYRWFAVFLLEGIVCEKLSKYVKNLLSPPNTMVKSWAKLQPRTELMHRTLVLKQVKTKSALIEQWKKNPSYLLEAYQKWLPESAHDEVAIFWPPVDVS